MAFPTPLEAFEAAISAWEGAWEDSPSDSGNYAHCWNGEVNLIGTMRGVTPDIYAAWLDVDPATITGEQMQAEISLELAAQIGVKLFYTPIQLLEWSPFVAIAMDIDWGSGKSRAVHIVQALVGAEQDGVAGPITAGLVSRYLVSNDIATACDALTQARIAFYRSISEPGMPDAKYRDGWVNRANWFQSSQPSPAWFDAWRGWTP
jgi:lysozyme family protein